MENRKGARILVVDDHVEMARVLAEQLGDAGYVVAWAESGRDAQQRLRAEVPDLVITDLRMADVDGFDVLGTAREVDPGMPVLVMTAFGAIDSAIEAIKRGAYHYLTKPFQIGELLVFVERALADRSLRNANEVLRRATTEEAAGSLVGSSIAMRRLLDLIAKVAPSPAPVLITGESGTGKELVARTIHATSPRRDQPFVAVNCPTLPEALLESELFGHVRGVFPGSMEPRRGLFAVADGGTLLLDGIGDMPAALQAKLLRVLDNGEVRPVGSDAIRRVDVRLLATSNQDLEKRVATGAFRPELFFRLNVLTVPVPALRDRLEDVPELVRTFLDRAQRRNPAVRARTVGADALAMLSTYAWPGNVRELENLIERLVILAPGAEIGVKDLEAHVRRVTASPSPADLFQDRIATLREMEDKYIGWAISRCGGNKTRAAELLGIDVSTIHRRERDRAASA